MKQYGEVKCTKSGTINGHTFKIGEIYPILGWNNGHHLVYENEKGDIEELILLNIDFHLEDGDDIVRFESNKKHKTKPILITAFAIMILCFVGLGVNKLNLFYNKDICLDTRICKAGLSLNINGNKVTINEKTCIENKGEWNTKRNVCKLP